MTRPVRETTTRAATSRRSGSGVRALLVTGTLALAPAVACVAAAVLWAPDALEKVLTDLVMPLGALWIGLGWLLVASVYCRRGTGQIAATATLWLVCWLSGNGFLAERLANSLESDMRRYDPFVASPFDAIVLLGGSLETGPHGNTQVNANGDRLVLAARLFHLGRTQRIVCTGARIDGISSLEADEGELAAGMLRELGVPADRITVLGGRTTSEEVRVLAAHSEELGTRVGVISSAWHLPRVLRLARAEGLDLEPLPAGFISSGDDPQPAGTIIRKFIPRSESLFQISRACRESLAAVVGR